MMLPRSALACLLSVLVICLAPGVDVVPPASQAAAAASPPMQDEQAPLAAAEAALAPVRTDTPRDTVRSFMLAMDRHAQAKRDGDPRAGAWLEDAVRCFDLSKLNLVGRERAAAEAAVLLKEVIDRVVAIDYDRIPTATDLPRWRLRNTEISLVHVSDGERSGEYLFSGDTVSRARDFYEKVRDLPLLPGAIGGGLVPGWQVGLIPKGLLPEVFGVAYWQWILLAALIFVGLAVRLLARAGAFVLKRIIHRTSVTWDDALVDALIGPMTHLGTTGIWFVSLYLIGVTGTAYTVLAFLIKGAFFINLAYLAYQLAGFISFQIEQHLKSRYKDMNHGLLRLIGQTLKLLAIIFCLLLGAQNMGMDVASLIAGLGIGGLAFALAAKDTLANLFGSIMIMIDRPFRVGDVIVAKGAEGTVESIGFRCTRLRTFSNSLVSIPNCELVMANIDNLGMRQFRRVNTTLSLTYDTPPERIEAFCAGVKDIILADPSTRRDFVHVCFSAYGAASLDVMVYFFLAVPDWAEELVHRQAIYLDILRLAERLQVRFAFPTQTLHIESLPAHPVPVPGARGDAGLAPPGAIPDVPRPAA